MHLDIELKKRMDYINKVLIDNLPEDGGFYSLIIEPMKYSVEAGGKRLRPMLISEAFKLLNGDPSHRKVVEQFMTAIEYIHTYSLVHDDLPAMDNDSLRRGLPTTHVKYGEDIGILTGDSLLNYAYEIVFKTALNVGKIDSEYAVKVLKAGEELSRSAGLYGMISGQTLDVIKTGHPISKEELDFIFDLKTGALIRASLKIGAILAGCTDDELAKIEKAGKLIGLAFQIRDDMLDEIGKEEDIGKPVHSDADNMKTTYVSLYGLEKAQEDVESYSSEAIEILKSLGNNEFLTELITYLTVRNK